MKEYTPLHVNFDKKLDRLLYRILQGEEVSSYEIISGRILRVEFEGDRYIKIEDKIKGELYMLSSYINPIEGSSNEYSAGFSLYTRNNLLSGAEFVHPDIMLADL